MAAPIPPVSTTSTLQGRPTGEASETVDMARLKNQVRQQASLEIAEEFVNRRLEGKRRLIATLTEGMRTPPDQFPREVALVALVEEVGAVMLSLESFSRLARRAHVPEADHPMDIDPSREDNTKAEA